jgi:hypothetical protein
MPVEDQGAGQRIASIVAACRTQNIGNVVGRYQRVRNADIDNRSQVT